ncbi:hypothetical protein N790_00280 [Arenimonas malthae CC-JY-1]|uniref:AAA+ ATPase domain-containing protein n=1 Tax=Arenimonas malthae CC-JY-1 TaxID=1384054 RepID=A0A091C6E7_9GAMM|nr:TniB family NTP-binding protein [Arenimonas malthae]KFN52240.1 hypothetical protein N790_00280 [Arenimonas malthae CC-JY-1]
MTDYSHLDPKTQAWLELPDLERANRMLIDRFITHERLQPIMDHIDFLRFSPPKSRASGLVVSGLPGSGKTMIARAIERRYPPIAAEGSKAASLPVLTIEMTGAREARALYDRILTELGVPDPKRYVGSDRERMVLKLCRAANLRLLVVDEIQDILTSTARQQRIALDTIKFLMNQLSLPVLALGTAQAPDAMQVDEHLNARFTYRSLPVWKQDPYLVNFLDALERVLPLKQPSQLSSLPITTALLRLSDGVLDPMMRLITYAAAHAVESGTEQITPQLLERARVEMPTAAVRLARERANEPAKAA